MEWIVEQTRQYHIAIVNALPRDPFIKTATSRWVLRIALIVNRTFNIIPTDCA